MYKEEQFHNRDTYLAYKFIDTDPEMYKFFIKLTCKYYKKVRKKMNGGHEFVIGVHLVEALKALLSNASNNIGSEVKKCNITYREIATYLTDEIDRGMALCRK